MTMVCNAKLSVKVFEEFSADFKNHFLRFHSEMLLIEIFKKKR